MSCNSHSSLFSGIAARLNGITRPANKQAFTVGLALGGAGLVGAGLLALARRISTGKKQVARSSFSNRQLPNLPTRPQIAPQSQSRMSGAERCVKCGTSAGGKQGNWYLIDGRRYCQDCAPQAARQTNVELTAPSRPKPAGDSLANGGGSSTPSHLMPGQARRSPAYLSPEKRVPTRLAESRIRLNVGQLPDGQPAWFVVNQGQVVLRPDGSDTGLAITPAVRIGTLKNGTQEVEEDTSQWMLTHISSGRSLGNRAFDKIETAHQLAGILAQLDWTRPANEISDQEVQQVNQTFYYYSQALQAEQVRRPTGAADHTSTSIETQPSGQSVSGGNSAGLTGQLISDPYGGVARVLEDSRKSDTLFVVDSLGHRYEINHSEARAPKEDDFRLGRIAMPIEATGSEHGQCSQCNQSATKARQGDTWYRMDYKTFCPACAGSYAEQEAYLMPDEINSELEAM